MIAINQTITSKEDKLKQDIRRSMMLVVAIGNAIQEAGSIPSGHLYAMLCGKLDINTYNTAIAILIKSKVVKSENHLLIWIGPKKENDRAG